MDMKQTNPSSGRENRRNFIKKTATAAAAVASVNVFKQPVYGQSQAPSTGRVIGANDRIVVGHIGVGGQGMAHVRPMKQYAKENNIAQAAVCDVWSKRTEGAKAFIEKDNPEAKIDTYEDYRKMLERNDIDAIICATVDHWHTRVSVDAMNSGKHVYVEKPMTRYLGEALEIYDTCKKTGKILQVGSQGCSDMKWHKAAELIRSGAIGKLVLAQGSYMRNNHKGEWNYPIDPDLREDNCNWKRWVGGQIKNAPAKLDPDHYFRWRKYYPYCAGLLGDLFPHKLHPYMLATGNPQFPVRVACVGSRKVETDKLTPGTYMRDVPEIVQLIAEFPDGMLMHITSSTVNEVGTQEMIRGHKATLTMAGNRVDLKPERPFTEEIDPESFEGFKGENVPDHEKNWLTSIRENKQPHAGIDLAVKVQTVISLAEISERLNVMCVFDEKSRKITTADGKEVKPITYGTLELS
jgi:predicted dehydrogenase